MISRHHGPMSGRERVEGILGALESARQDLLDYDPPWVESGFEDLRIAVDRTLRSVELAIAKLADEVGRAPTEPAPGSTTS